MTAPHVLTDEWLQIAADEFDANSVAPDDRITVTVTVLGSPAGDVQTCWELEGGKLQASKRDGDADVALSVPWESAIDLLEASSTPAVAYMQGKLKGGGDMVRMLELLRGGQSQAFAAWCARVRD